jgi:hypothetical protein
MVITIGFLSALQLVGELYNGGVIIARILTGSFL